MSRCFRLNRTRGKEKGRRGRERNLHPYSILIFSRETKLRSIYIYCVRSGRKALRVFLSTPLEDSRRLHPRHLARGINYRGGFTPVTVLPDRYPPSIRIKAGKGEGRERASAGFPRINRPPRSEDIEDDLLTDLLHAFSLSHSYPYLPGITVTTTYANFA